MFKMGQVQFTAKCSKLTLSSKNKVELELPEGMPFAKIAEIAAFKGHDLIIQFGNPQVEMLFEPKHGGGMVARVDEHGVVENVQREGQDPDKPPFFDDGEGEDKTAAADQEDGGLSEEEELDFGGDGDSGEQEDGNAADPEEEQESEEDESEAAAAVSKGELEEFIVYVRPAFPDIPYDFPSIVERKNEPGQTWIKVAVAIGVNSTKLQTAYRKYKERVQQLILEQRGDQSQEESNGAA